MQKTPGHHSSHLTKFQSHGHVAMFRFKQKTTRFFRTPNLGFFNDFFRACWRPPFMWSEWGHLEEVLGTWNYIPSLKLTKHNFWKENHLKQISNLIFFGLPETNKHSTWKWMVGRRLFLFGEGNSGRDGNSVNFFSQWGQAFIMEISGCPPKPPNASHPTFERAGRKK